MTQLLRWFIGSQDVTCAVCRQPIYRPIKGQHICPRCVAELNFGEPRKRDV